MIGGIGGIVGISECVEWSANESPNDCNLSWKSWCSDLFAFTLASILSLSLLASCNLLPNTVVSTPNFVVSTPILINCLVCFGWTVSKTWLWPLEVVPVGLGGFGIRISPVPATFTTE